MVTAVDASLSHVKLDTDRVYTAPDISVRSAVVAL